MLVIVAVAKPIDEAAHQIDPRRSKGCRERMGKQSAA
jgi:hypothetical protein